MDATPTEAQGRPGSVALSTSDKPTSDKPVDKPGLEALYATGHWLLSQDRPADASCVFRAMALLTPQDERPWLALGACHEALGQWHTALEMYGTGRVLACPSVRCDVARARVFRAQGRDDEAEAALEHAKELAEARDDEALIRLVAQEENRR
jgi:Flp pilus assembly protein TadD